MNRRDFIKNTAGAAIAASAARAGNGMAVEMPEQITLAAVGDCILTRKISAIHDKQFAALRALLQHADCSWGNCEIVFADIDKVYPSPKELDPHMLCPPWGVEELKWLGIDFMGTANNHTMDWGYEGLQSTLSGLGRVGIASAGSGLDLEHAARPGYFDSPAGRIAQVNCASSFPLGAAAGKSHPYVRGRPGLNPLNVLSAIQVDAQMFDRISVMSDQILESRGWGVFKEAMDKFLPPGMVLFDNMPIMKGDEFERLSIPDQQDVERITQAVSVARNNARIVMVTIHAHEGRDDLEIPDTFLQPFARSCIDAGADLFIGTGPHVMRGIELYKGKPIFYSLGNFIFQYETQMNIPAGTYRSLGLDPATLDPTLLTGEIPYSGNARYWQSCVPVITFGQTNNGPQLEKIVLHPITMDNEQAVYWRGTPRLAGGKTARQIVSKLAELSRPFGTDISIRGNVGHIITS